MLQKEVVNRIIAKKGSKAYGWLSIISQLLCDVEVLFDVPKEAFTPAPKVNSSVVLLKPKVDVIPHNLQQLKIICHILFLHRRKMISSIIKREKQLHYLLSKVDELQIDLKMRPEDIDIKTFCKISQTFRNGCV